MEIALAIELYAAFVLASVLLILIPGPNVALIVANSLTHGVRAGLLTVAGTSAAMVIQLSLTVAGLSGLLALLSHWFEWLRWLGVAYLLYLGVKAWTAETSDGRPSVQADGDAGRVMFWRGFFVSLTNPKTLFFYGAFLPQFVVPGEAATAQLGLLALTFLAIAVVLDSGWAIMAHRLRGVASAGGRMLNRLTGGILVGAAAGLALARKP